MGKVKIFFGAPHLATIWKLVCFASVVESDHDNSNRQPSLLRSCHLGRHAILLPNLCLISSGVTMCRKLKWWAYWHLFNVTDKVTLFDWCCRCNLLRSIWAKSWLDYKFKISCHSTCYSRAPQQRKVPQSKSPITMHACTENGDLCIWFFMAIMANSMAHKHVHSTPRVSWFPIVSSKVVERIFSVPSIR